MGLIWLIIAGLVLILTGPSEAVTRFVSPTTPTLVQGGTAGVPAGNASLTGTDSNNPTTVAHALSLSISGDQVALRCGNATGTNKMWYRGANDMIVLPANMSGITVRAESGCAGFLLVDGEFARRPISLPSNNDNNILQDFDARHGSDCVACVLGGSDNNIFRRIVVWDMQMYVNAAPVSLHGNTGNLFEDFAAFGVGRKTFTNSQGGNNVTCRRCWLRWDASTASGGLTVTTTYNSYGFTCEGCLIEWSALSQPDIYTVSSTGTVVNDTTTPYQPAGMLGVDRIDSPNTLQATKCANVNLRNTIVYVQASAQLPTAALGGQYGPMGPIYVSGLSCYHLQDVLAVIAPSHTRFNSNTGIVLQRQSNGGTITCGSDTNVCTQVTADHISSIIGTLGDLFHADWVRTNYKTATSLASLQSQGADPWTDTGGARLCTQYNSTTPAWPFPMNQRIIDATTIAGVYGDGYTFAQIGCDASGAAPNAHGNCKNSNGTPFTFPSRPAVNLTTIIEGLLGTIPSQCLSGGAVTPVLTTSPASLTFNATAGLANPTNQTFTITDTASSGSLSWSVSDDAAWLTVTPTSGTGDAAPIVSVDTTGLAAGTYNSTITITAPGATGTPKTVTVTLNLSSPPIVPVLLVSQTALTYTTFVGVTPPSQSFTITDTANSGVMSWTATDTASWLTVTPSSGAGNQLVTASINVAGLVANTYLATITVSAPGATGTPQTVSVTLIIASSPGHQQGGRVR